MEQLKCKTCGKEYLIDEEELIKVNGVYGIYCKDSCGAFVDVKEMEQGKEKHVDLRCSKCNTPLDSNKVNNAVLECPHCHEKMTFTKNGQTQDVINTINLGKAELSICNFDSAYKYFDEAIKKDPNEPEAYFGKVLAEYNIQYLRDFSHFKEEGTNGIVLQPICYQENIENIRNDSNYKKAIELASEEQKKVYEQKLKEIEEIHKYFLELEKKKLNYDCFICVKVSENNNGKYTQDSIYASKLYDKLKEYGYHPFYSEKEKEKNGGWLGNIYEANILYGLYKSKCMIIVCSDKDYLDTQWVKSEYSRYIALMKYGKKEQYSLLITYIDNVIEKLPGISHRLEGIKFDGFDTSDKLKRFVEKFCGPDANKSNIIESDDKNNYFDAFERNDSKQNNDKNGHKSDQNKEQIIIDNSNVILDGVKYEISHGKARVVGYTNEILNHLVIPSEIIANGKNYIVTEIRDEAFVNCNCLKSIVIPNSIKKIGKRALNEINSGFGDFIVYCEATKKPIGWHKLWNDKKRPVYWGLTSDNYSIQDGIIYVINDGNAVVTGHTEQLPNFLEIPKSIFVNEKEYRVTSIGKNAFESCGFLFSIVIPKGLINIGKHAFEGCYSLTIYCEASSSANGWDKNWNFEGRPVYWGKTKNDIIYQDLLQFLIVDGDAVVTGHTIKIASDITIPSTIIANGVTYNVTSIGELAFDNCAYLTSIVIPKSVTSIGNGAFAFFGSLSSVVIPDTVINIGCRAFYNPYLDFPGITIYCEAESQPSGWDSKWDADNSIVYWGINSENRLVQDGIIYLIDDGNAVVTGHTNEISTIVIPSSVTINGKTYDVKSIGNCAFAYCYSLTSLVIPKSITSIGVYAFIECQSLTIYSELSNQPTGWQDSGLDDDIQVYWLDQWIYGIYGEPHPIYNPYK